jgi:SOS response regulatory protein OraA/RecX
VSSVAPVFTEYERSLRPCLASAQSVLATRPIPPNPPRITALQRVRAGVVRLEVDGRPWRAVPDEVVLRCGLAPGVELERPLLRRLRRELRRAEALGVASRTLRRRDLSAARLAERLERAGVAAAPTRETVALLAAAGALDDARLARARAASLAERGWGDRAISARLAGDGIGAEDVADAIEALPPERERADSVAAKISDRRKAWSTLARRGFSPEAIDEVVGALDDEPGGGLG